jgi:Suppressor of fused protein (SUFU)
MFQRRKREHGLVGPTLRHRRVDRDFIRAEPNEIMRKAFDDHVTRFLGPCTSVFHEIASDLVHVDVYMWEATIERPMHTFVTSGMSDRPMHLPADLVNQRPADRAELVVCVPPSWPLPSHSQVFEEWRDERYYFPIRGLRSLARLQHEYNTWLGFGHTVPTGDPPTPFAEGTRLCGWGLCRPQRCRRILGCCSIRACHRFSSSALWP